jgi:hypothetical protein
MTQCNSTRERMPCSCYIRAKCAESTHMSIGVRRLRAMKILVATRLTQGSRRVLQPATTVLLIEVSVAAGNGR